MGRHAEFEASESRLRFLPQRNVPRDVTNARAWGRDAIGIAKFGIFNAKEVRAVTRLDADDDQGLRIGDVERGTDSVTPTFVLEWL